MYQISDFLFEEIQENYPELAEHILMENKPENSCRYISREKRYEVLRRQKWRCNICGCKLKYSKENSWEGEVAHIDHIFPYTQKEFYFNREENINELSNLQALCPKCNLTKSSKEIQ